MYDRSYHHRVLKTDSQSKEKHPFPWKRMVVWGIAILFIVGSVLFIRMPRFQIQTINVTGTNVADPIEVADYVMNQLQGTYLWILPKTSVILIAPDNIQSLVQQHFARFKTVAVNRDSMSSLRVAVTEYPGVYLWCDSEDTCSFMDETGTVFADAPYFSGSAYLKIYNGERAAYPFHPITDQQLVMVHTINNRLTAMDISSLSFSFISDRELRVTFFHNGSHTAILFDPADDVIDALDTLYTGLRTQPLVHLFHDDSKVLQYIDVRFGNKLVYKFQ